MTVRNRIEVAVEVSRAKDVTMDVCVIFEVLVATAVDDAGATASIF